MEPGSAGVASSNPEKRPDVRWSASAVEQSKSPATSRAASIGSPAQRCRQEKPGRLIEALDFDAGFPALDEQPDRPGLDIDCSKRLIVARQNRVPDCIGRMSEPNKADGGMGDERYPALVLGADSAEQGDVERCGVGRVQRVVHRPFQFGDISEINDRFRLGKSPKKVGKRAAEPVEPGLPRRMFGNEELSGACEEFLADQSFCRGKGEPERPGQGVNERIAIDVKPIRGDVPREHRGNRLVIPVDEARLHRGLHFKQRRHDRLRRCLR